jgi:hypothetical protein
MLDMGKGKRWEGERGDYLVGKECSFSTDRNLGLIL